MVGYTRLFICVYGMVIAICFLCWVHWTKMWLRRRFVAAHHTIFNLWIAVFVSQFVGRLIPSGFKDYWLPRSFSRHVIISHGIDPLYWRHNDHDGVSNNQHHGCLLKRLFRRRSKKTSKLRVTGLCVGFPAQRASYAENVSIWWRHHAWDMRASGTRYYFNVLP